MSAYAEWSDDRRFLLIKHEDGRIEPLSSDNIVASGQHHFMRTRHPVDVFNEGTQKKIVVKNAKFAFDHLYQGGRHFEKMILDCLGDMPNILTLDLCAIVSNHNSVDCCLPPCVLSTITKNMGTQLATLFSALDPEPTIISLDTEEIRKANGWGDSITNAEADIVLMSAPVRNGDTLAHTDLDGGALLGYLGGMVRNCGGYMKLASRNGLAEVTKQTFDNVRLVLGEVTLPQSQLPYKLLQLQRDYDILVGNRGKEQEGRTRMPRCDANFVLHGCDTSNTVLLVCFNGASQTALQAGEELNQLINMSTLNIRHCKIVFVYCPYTSVVSTMATAKQLDQCRAELTHSIQASETRLNTSINRSITASEARVTFSLKAFFSEHTKPLKNRLANVATKAELETAVEDLVTSKQMIDQSKKLSQKIDDQAKGMDKKIDNLSKRLDKKIDDQSKRTDKKIDELSEEIAGLSKRMNIMMLIMFAFIVLFIIFVVYAQPKNKTFP